MRWGRWDALQISWWAKTAMTGWIRWSCSSTLLSDLSSSISTCTSLPLPFLMLMLMAWFLTFSSTHLLMVTKPTLHPSIFMTKLHHLSATPNILQASQLLHKGVVVWRMGGCNGAALLVRHHAITETRTSSGTAFTQQRHWTGLWRKGPSWVLNLMFIRSISSSLSPSSLPLLPPSLPLISLITCFSCII